MTHEASMETREPEAQYAMVLACEPNGDGPVWKASVEELPGCEVHGPTPESAAAGIGEAVERWVREARAEGRAVPPPGAAATHSGRLLVRMPRSLHADLVRVSEREGTSLNAYIVGVLSASVAWRHAGDPERQPAAPASRGLSIALIANLAVLAVAAAIAIALLITAWQG